MDNSDIYVLFGTGKMLHIRIFNKLWNVFLFYLHKIAFKSLKSEGTKYIINRTKYIKFSTERNLL